MSNNNTAVEMLDVVDENDQVVGQTPYESAYKNQSTIRLVHITIFTGKDEIVIQQRGFHKPKNGGTWMTSAGGHVRSGESYEEGAKRELKEELGIKVPLEFVWKDILIDETGHKKFASMFFGQYKGRDFVMDPVETQQVRVASFNEIKEMIKSGQPFHPEFLTQLSTHFSFDI